MMDNKQAVNCGLQIAKEILKIKMEQLNKKFMKEPKHVAQADLLYDMICEIEKAQRKNSDQS